MEELTKLAEQAKELAEQCKVIGPAFRCADLLRELAAGRHVSWFEVVEAIRALDKVRYGD